MPSNDRRLDLAARRKILTNLRAQRPLCHLCGLPIDLNADPQRDPLALCGDEIIPRSKGGDPLDPRNVAPAMRLCNGLRSDEYPITNATRMRCRRAVLKLTGQAEQPTTTRNW